MSLTRKAALGVVVASAATCAMVGSVAGEARAAGNYYGALALSSSTGAVASAVNYPDAAAAETAARDQCGIRDCRVVVQFWNACGSVARAMNLRGVRESGRAFATPTYAFIAGIMVMNVVGSAKSLFGEAPVAESAHYEIRAEQVGLSAAALAFLVLRAFSSGCTALTGAEAISNGVPAFRKPKALNAARTMAAATTKLAAVEGAPAVRTKGDGDQRAVAAAVVEKARPVASRAQSRRSTQRNYRFAPRTEVAGGRRYHRLPHLAVRQQGHRSPPARG